jgi:hypothetical protein
VRATSSLVLAACALVSCTESLHVPGDPVGCDPLGGAVDGTFLDPAAKPVSFNAVTATLTAPTTITLTDGTLSLVLGIGTPPRDIDLVFPGRPVLATTGKVIIDEDLACYAGRFDATFQYHGEISGWFAVP